MTGKHRVILIRHVKTEYNETKRISGQADIAILQDTALEFIDDFTGVIYSSPLKRCRQTLEKLCPKLLDSVVYDSRLTERCMGIFEGNKRFEMQQKFPEYFIKGKLNVFKTIPEGEAFSEFYERVYSFYLDRLVKAEKNVIWNAPIMMFTVYTCIILISWFGAKMIVVDSLTTGELMSLLAYCMNILMSLMMLSMVFVMISMSMASMRRIAEVLNEKTDIHNPEHPVYEVADGSITFKNVDFSYKKDSAEKVLKDINLEIRSGETIGIIGGTGSAKTSLVNLISRLYDVTDGEILVGGKNVKEYDLEVLRNQVSVVLQKNVLFTGSILDNLRWGDKEATDEECIQACKLACADEFIERFPDKYNTH